MYKYGSKKYMHGLAERGEIKIGTLFGYKYMEEQKKGVNDPLEGEYINELMFKDYTFGNNPAMDGIFANEIGRFFGGRMQGLGFHNVSICEHRKASNHLIYCTSFEKSLAVMKEFDADCCVEITRPNMFFKLVTYELNKIIKNTFMDTHVVEYGEHTRVNEIRKEMLKPILAKTPDFSGQKEMRSIWSVPQDSLDMINNDGYILKIPQLKKFCKVVKVR